MNEVGNDHKICDDVYGDTIFEFSDKEMGDHYHIYLLPLLWAMYVAHALLSNDMELLFPKSMHWCHKLELGVLCCVVVTTKLSVTFLSLLSQVDNVYAVLVAF